MHLSGRIVQAGLRLRFPFLVRVCRRAAWDNKTGGFYDAGYYFKDKPGLTIISTEKNWWSQAEEMNTLLLMSRLFPNDPMHYYDKFKQEWKYIQTYMIDYTYGDWYSHGLDIEPENKTALKGSIWKGN